MPADWAVPSWRGFLLRGGFFLLAFSAGTAGPAAGRNTEAVGSIGLVKDCVA